MNVFDKTTTFGLIVGTRGFFNSELAVQGRKDLLAKLDSLGYDYVIPPEDATPNGAIETYADAKICAEVFKARRDDIDGIVVVLPNFGDEMGVVYTLDMADLNVPVLVQACDDADPMKLLANERRDAFCGKFSVCNNLYQFGIPFTDTTYHTCPIDSDEFTKDLDFFARVCRVVKGLTHMRVGAIGARPSPFHTCRYSEKLLQSTGITVVTVDMSEMMAAATRPAGQRRSGSGGQSGRDQRTTARFPATSRMRMCGSRQPGRWQSKTGWRRTNATPAPSNAGPRSRKITAAPPA